MNELHKYATFSVDLLGRPKKINSMFSMGRARIFYKGLNRNRSIIEGDVAEKLASSIPGTPVIGHYNEESGDFGGHDDKQCAYGFVPLNPNYAWVETNGHEYLEVDVVIWDGRFEEAKSILKDNKSLSMELNPRTMKGTFVECDNMTCYKITFAEFAGITVLGDDVEPCFEDAQFITAYSEMVSAYALFVENAQKNVKGGNDVMKNENIIVEPEVTTEEEAIVEEEVVEETAAEEVAEETTVEAETAEEPVTEEETEETVETEFDIIEEDNEVCPEEVQEPEEGIEEEKEESEEIAEEVEETVPKADYEALEAKYNEATALLNEYTRKEKLEIISKFSTKLENEEVISELTDNVDSLTIEEVKTELGKALVEEIAAKEESNEEENEESNFSLIIENDNTVRDSAWDLVRSYKENK